jgi:hypothetical protein
MDLSRCEVYKCCEEEEVAINVYLLDLESFLLIETNAGPGGRAV